MANKLEHCLQHSIKCRIEVLNDMKKYRVHPKFRVRLLKNLNHFKIKLRKLKET